VPRSRPLARAVLFGTVPLALVLPGCSSGSSGTLPTSVKPSTAVTSAPSTMPPPTLPAEARQATRAGASAFFRYFWAVYNHAYASMDTTLLRSISDSTCKSCLQVADEVDMTKRNGERVTGGVVTVAVAVAADGKPAQGMLVNGLVEQTPSTVLSSTGRVISTAPANNKRRVDAAVRWDGANWHMMGFDVLEAGA
jgi:hypothetical protein